MRNHDIIQVHRFGEWSYDKQAFKRCEAVFVNGEGAIHHDCKLANFLLGVLKEGQRLKKKSLLVNCVFQDMSPHWGDVLKKLDYFSVREPLSAEHAKRCGGNPEVLLDSCADPQFLNGKPIRQLSKIVVGDTLPSSPVGAESPGGDVLSVFRYERFRLTCLFEDFVATLKTTKCYITGQHHGVYGAGLAGVPFVPLPSNTHKIESLIQWSGLPIKVCRTAKEVKEQIPYALRNHHIYKAFHKFLLSKDIFDAAKADKILGKL